MANISADGQAMSNGTQGGMRHTRIIETRLSPDRPNLMHEQTFKESESHEAFNLQNNNILTNLNPVNQEQEVVQTEQRLAAGQETLYFKKSKFTNPSTGRDNQILSCLKCDYTTSILGNMKTHIRFHFQFKPFKCVICEKTFCQRHQLYIHMSKNSCTPAVIVSSL